ncbi:MAG: hypothetical protein V1792_00210 [Pseudomonadota bacterium]
MNYGTYLNAVRRFLVDNRHQFGRLLHESVAGDGESIIHIDIVAEKHGSEYHPARVVARGTDRTASFVVNTAVNDRGRDRLTKDFHLLRELGSRFPRTFVPAVYFTGDVSVPGDGDSPAELSMFLGEWLEGFHEFHLSHNEANGCLDTVVWDTDQGYGILPVDQSESLHNQAAFILAYYYDPDGFREIFPWHHAAGDFVVSRLNGGLRVKLITARQYAPRLIMEQASPENRLQALMLFIANLTIRMRLDRLDGVGEIAWAGDHSVGATILGALDGIRAKIQDDMCDPALLEAFLAAASRMSAEDVTRLVMEVVGCCDEDAPDMPVIRLHLADHILLVYRNFQNLSSRP